MILQKQFDKRSSCPSNRRYKYRHGDIAPSCTFPQRLILDEEGAERDCQVTVATNTSAAVRVLPNVASLLGPASAALNPKTLGSCRNDLVRSEPTFRATSSPNLQAA